MSDANQYQGEPRLIVDANALRTNLRTLRRHLASDVKFCAVLKANAYGHSAVNIANALIAIESESPFLRTDQFAVATFDEALTIEELDKPIMLLRPVENAFLGRQRELIEHAIRRGWTIPVASPTAAEDIARIALHLQLRANVQIMLDTGMSRGGVSASDFSELLERILHHASLKLAGVMTHFASSERTGDSYTSDQLRLFQRTTEAFPILESIPRHAANSGAIFTTPRAHFDMVRAGIALYGIDPTGNPAADRSLAPVGKLVAPLIAILDIEPGQSVGYGQTWIASQRTKVGVVAIGYADGYPRLASNRGIVMVNDRPCGVIGRVSMDVTTIILTHIDDVSIGDDVTMIDSNPLSPASVYATSTIANTIPYEIMCGLGNRVQRVLTGIASADDTEPPENT